MGLVTRIRKRIERLQGIKDERGAEAVEFAIIGPLLFFVLIGVMYALFLLASQLSVARAATVGVRYAAINEGSGYPSAGQINTAVLDQTPLFDTGDCTTDTANSQLAGSGVAPNSQVTLSVSCDFPNVLGRAMGALRSAMFGDSGSPTDSTLELTATARSRKE